MSTAVDMNKIDPRKESEQADANKEAASIVLVSDFTTVANRENEPSNHHILQVIEHPEEATVSEQIQNLPLEDK